MYNKLVKLKKMTQSFNETNIPLFHSQMCSNPLNHCSEFTEFVQMHSDQLQAFSQTFGILLHNQPLQRMRQMTLLNAQPESAVVTRIRILY